LCGNCSAIIHSALRAPCAVAGALARLAVSLFTDPYKVRQLMARSRKNPLLALLDASFLIGALCTGIFYLVICSPQMQGSLLHRYTTEHLVEYVVVALSFWGLADVCGKLLSYPRQYLALRHQWFTSNWIGREPVANAEPMLEAIGQESSWLRESRIGRRLTEALDYIVQNGCDEHYRDYLKSLAEKDEDQTHSSFTLIRFVVRITPVLGFLGTVVHFGTALNGISLDQMSQQLGVVVSEMGKAFNATTAALASAMFMMFAQFAGEWIERSIVHSIDRTVERELANRFEVKDANLLPFLRVARDANEDVLKLIAGNLDRQTAVWTQAFEALLSRFDARQAKETDAWVQALDVLSSRHESFDTVREERLRQMLDVIDERQEKFMNHVHKTLEKAVAIRDDFGGMVETLHGIARGEGQLAQLQSSLAENLRLIHETGKIDDALHGLTGAIHLLTARNQPSGSRKAA
jgi:biopolymer transport protein ExbB/TolQ